MTEYKCPSDMELKKKLEEEEEREIIADAARAERHELDEEA